MCNATPPSGCPAESVQGSVWKLNKMEATDGLVEYLDPARPFGLYIYRKQ